MSKLLLRPSINPISTNSKETYLPKNYTYTMYIKINRQSSILAYLLIPTRTTLSRQQQREINNINKGMKKTVRLDLFVQMISL